MYGFSLIDKKHLATWDHILDLFFVGSCPVGFWFGWVVIIISVSQKI